MIRIYIDPIIASLGSFTLGWHGLFTFLGVAVAVYMVAQFARKASRFKEGVANSEVIYDIATWAILGGIVGARLFHVVDQWELYKDNPVSILYVWQGGIALYGGMLGGALTGAFYARFRGYPVGRIADITAPAMLVGQAVGRIGCTINGDAFGTPTDLPWGWVYTHPNSPVFGHPPSHPAAVYEIIWDLILFAVLWKLLGRLKPNGMIFLIYLASYSIGRFFISFLRLDRELVAGLREAQLIALAILIVTVPIIVYKVQWVKKEPQPTEPQEPQKA